MLGPYDQIISLGRSCQPAHQIRQILATESASLFDWLVTPDHGLMQVLANGTAGFFAADRLYLTPSGVVEDRVTTIQFFHEFPRGTDIAAAHAREAPRIAEMVRRWNALLAGADSVLFIRQHAWSGHPADRASTLHAALRAAAPALRFRLLYLSPPDQTPAVPDGQAEGPVIHRPLQVTEDWRGDTAIWQRLLDEVLFLDPPE